MVWILVVVIVALAIAALAAFALLVTGVRSTDRYAGLCDASGDSTARSFAHRVLGGVYVRQSESVPDACDDVGR